jgi:hypothetical protein
MDSRELPQRAQSPGIPAGQLAARQLDDRAGPIESCFAAAARTQVHMEMRFQVGARKGGSWRPAPPHDIDIAAPLTPMHVHLEMRLGLDNGTPVINGPRRVFRPGRRPERRHAIHSG